MSKISGIGSGTAKPHVVISHDYSTFEKNNYTARPPTFSGGSIEFEWWKSNMYTHIIGLYDELWDILEDGIDIPVNGVRMATDKKSLTPAQKKTYRKHHRVKGILVDIIRHSEYIKIIDKFTTKTIFESLCATYEGNQQVKEAKANLLVQQYELFRMIEYEDIETIFSRFQVIILRSLPVRHAPKVTVIQEAKNSNTLSFESLISNLYSHEIELNGEESAKKSNSLALRSVAKSTKAPQVWEFEEASCVEGSEEDSADEEVAFIIKRFQYLAKKNKIFS
ncbi:uncharacterized protein LOC127123595 [Lathyrus oleraceus]|uniref:uncharacterized protein LOC127123595 n=1 Tax=Pisum sativum TaxID=3888 RepID=UPI0021CF4F03|nr:uncharacterized protein LOC127123595 [Pisum sativum]